MIPIVWMLQSLHACAAASGAGFVEISAGYSTRYNDSKFLFSFFFSTPPFYCLSFHTDLMVPGNFLSKYQADASGLVHEVCSTFHFFCTMC